MGIIILMIGEYIMAIDKNRIKNFENNNAKNVKSKNVDKVNMELLLTLNETTGLIQEEKCKDAVPFILWNDFVNETDINPPAELGRLADASGDKRSTRI